MSSLIEDLTPLQFKVVILLAAGMTTIEIATFLNIGVSVVNTMIHNIYLRTGCTGKSSLVLRYAEEARQGLYLTDKFKNNVVELEARAQQMIGSRIPDQSDNDRESENSHTQK
jgi:DNA-binding CsgD family transcriptional regulator